ncbi:hypothetical protein BWK59_12840 [Flavobacterium davisii]|uniref:Transmembrane protein n=1 Tax=Flavobacterium davisii TaxID=2906077 RepID=A0A246GFU0_9FLAO|nr:hypothetical protein BWK59_12840 [Flavobacterium davisii]
MLDELYKNKVKFNFILLTVLLYPIFIQIIQIILGNIFIQFCPQVASQSNNEGLISLLNEVQSNNYPYPTQFNFFSYIEFPILCLEQIFFYKEFSFFIGFIFSPYILYFFLFYKFCLFRVFQENGKNPFTSLIPIGNDIQLLNICKLPISGIFILLIPFVRLFLIYKINKQLCKIQHINKSNAILMTLLRPIFYGKLIFK